MKEKLRAITLNLREEDVQWLEKVYGETWPTRMEQHIQLEVQLRRAENAPGLKMREPWDY